MKDCLLSRGLIAVRVTKKAFEATDICSFELRDVAAAPLPAFCAGAHIDVHIRRDPRPGLIRQYSLCNHPSERHRYEIAVLRDPSSRGGSQAMHDVVCEGSIIHVSEPKNHFPLIHAAKRTVLFAGGIGVTPLLCMAERLSSVGDLFEMHYCTRSRDRTALRSRIEQSRFADRVAFHFDDLAPQQKLRAARAVANGAVQLHRTQSCLATQSYLACRCHRRTTRCPSRTPEDVQTRATLQSRELPVGRTTITGGVITAGNRIMFDLHIDGTRFRPTLPWIPTASNLRRARARMLLYRAQIAAGTFSFAEEFPDYRGRRRLDLPARTFTCSEVFDRFLAHSAARVARDDLAPSTLASYRQILNYTWRPKIGRMPFLGVRYSTLIKIADAHTGSKKTYNNLVSAVRCAFAFGYRDHAEQRDPASFLKCARMRRTDRSATDPFPIAEAEALIAALDRDWGEAQRNFDEFRFFTGLRLSEQIALLVSDFDPVRERLAVTKSRVRRIDRPATKTGEDRYVQLCPRALSVLARQLRLREALKRAGRIDHEFLFFDRNGRFFVDTKNTYRRWRRTLQRLGTRYRRPNVARHSSISWHLMIGCKPLWVAKQHGNSPVLMLSTYAAWTEDVLKKDVDAIRRAMNVSPARTEPHTGIDELRPLVGTHSEPTLWCDIIADDRLIALRALAMQL